MFKYIFRRYLLVAATLFNLFIPSVEASPNYLTVKYRLDPVDVNQPYFEKAEIKGGSVVNNAWYDISTHYMIIDLSGINYHYCGLTPEVWNNFKQSSSKGQYYSSKIKGSFDCRLNPLPKYSERVPNESKIKTEVPLGATIVGTINNDIQNKPKFASTRNILRKPGTKILFGIKTDLRGEANVRWIITAPTPTTWSSNMETKNNSKVGIISNPTSKTKDGWFRSVMILNDKDPMGDWTVMPVINKVPSTIIRFKVLDNPNYGKTNEQLKPPVRYFSSKKAYRIGEDVEYYDEESGDQKTGELESLENNEAEILDSESGETVTVNVDNLE